jgi:hypothetical protein
MKTDVGRDWYQSIHFDELSCWQVSFSGPNGHHHQKIKNVFSVFSTF